MTEIPDETIQIFTTGGTIDKVYFDMSSDYQVGPPEIATILPAVGTTTSWEIETLMCKDSLDLTDKDRMLIKSKVENCPWNRILITHGTDTMVHTAELLKNVSGKTVVLVGSLSPAKFKGSDAEFNIGFALAAVQLMPPGAYIAMNGRVFSADRVRKNREVNRFEAIS